MAFEHVPVLLQKVLEFLPLPDGSTVLDGTLGLGGYSEAFLLAHPGWRVLGLDQDKRAQQIAAERLAPFGHRFCPLSGNFRDLEDLCLKQGVKSLDGIVFDLGVSNMQLTDRERGFSFKEDGPLDMRMDPSAKFSAAELVNEASAQELNGIFRDYGEEPFSWRIAQTVVQERIKKPIVTTGQLVEVIRSALPAPVMRKMKGHPARRVFQALRIAVNDELGALEEGLDGALGMIAPEGRIIVISYHSLEDRIVKHRFRNWKDQGLGYLDPRKALEPSEDEIESNPKSRSARLRGFVRRDLSKQEGRVGPWRR